MSNVFESLISAKRQEEADAAARREELRQQREAEEADRREKAAEARRQRELKEMRNRIKREINSFREGFYAAVIKKGSTWNSTTLELVSAYCQALASEVTDGNNVPTPTTNLSTQIKTIIHEKFAYGTYLAGDLLPANCLVGMRQDWFQDALESATAPRNGSKQDRIKISRPTISIPDPGEEVPAPQVQQGDNVVELRPAITQPAKTRRQA